MAEIPHITDHGDQAVARLAQQFREGVSVPALVRIHAARLQALEDVFRDLLTKRWIDTAAGAQLDVLGKIVGQPREGRADDVYRIWLRARVRLNLGSGTPEDLLAIFSAITQGTATIVLEEQYPAAFVLKVGSTAVVDPVQLAAILRLARPAGVQAVLESATSNDPTSFACDPNGAGCGDVNNAATGGTLATAL